ncbi:GNAT family N-acetyltransferase [Rubellicoccus peritrichatus]|uniref:GNAT family N-acetyltransferase n=1 Tax=Rubellicoccus peritrichatus TaxID=3080537 RepID=A0AAQ3QVJ3_9BACT|nr:GNAT family N-acetyltransferase [Puniceicoccus sp. CR14]WOO41673.1 GNAT family N-acetyltransferase [Puniceicoccus sp. CR14]
MIKGATVADAKRIAEIHVQTWKVAYDGIVTSSYLESLSIESRANRWEKSLSQSTEGTLVYEETARVVGWVSYGPCRDKGESDKGEIYAIYVLPDHWGNKYGKKLILAAEENLRQSNLKEITLWVLEKNSRARLFYEQRGYSADGMKKELTMDGIKLIELRYAKSI